jgi:hypothetical protein
MAILILVTGDHGGVGSGHGGPGGTIKMISRRF